MSRRSDEALSFGIGTLAGVLIGVAAALFFTPKSGAEMRKELKAASKKLLNGKYTQILYTNKVSREQLVRLQYGIEKQFNKVIDAIKANRMALAKRREESESTYNYQ